MGGSGLRATELAQVVAELDVELRGAVVRDSQRLAGRDDLLLYLDLPGGGGQALQIAPGGARARLCTTRRRFPRAAFATGPLIDRLRARLAGARLLGASAPPGERCCRLELEGTGGALALVVELFGPRGLWCLLDTTGQVLELSRLQTTKHRTLRPGAPYLPPPASPPRAAAAGRFAAPVLAQVDAHFSSLDLAEEQQRRRTDLQRALERELRRATELVGGLARQRAEIERAPELRRRADLLLAYGFGAARGERRLLVPDPDRAGEQLEIPLDPALPVPAQADRLYKRARKLEDAGAVATRRAAEAEQRRHRLDALLGWLATAPDDELDELAGAAAELGIAPRPPRGGAAVPPPRRARGSPAGSRPRKGGRDDYRRFQSADGTAILVGRTNEENDRLTLRTAHGNDIWMHVGRGYAGSHVVVRVPRGKTASLETLLDAAALAIHFSKARGQPSGEVIYTRVKHVRKPKGAPAGRVVPHLTKTLSVRSDAGRLQRLLESGA